MHSNAREVEERAHRNEKQHDEELTERTNDIFHHAAAGRFRRNGAGDEGAELKRQTR